MKLSIESVGRYGDSDILCRLLLSKYGVLIPEKLADCFYKHDEAYVFVKLKNEAGAFVCISRNPTEYSLAFKGDIKGNFSAAVMLVKWNRAKVFLIKDPSA